MLVLYIYNGDRALCEKKKCRYCGVVKIVLNT
jgi:hypothetical protein